MAPADSITATDTATQGTRDYRLGGPVVNVAAGNQLVATFVDDAPVLGDPNAEVTETTLRLAWPGSIADPIDPAAAPVTANPWLAQMERMTCATLMRQVAGEAKPRLLPDLAASPPRISADRRTYRFTVQPGRGFAPPSEETVSARDVASSIERALSPRLGPRPPAGELLDGVIGVRAYRDGHASRIAGIRAVGQELTIHLARPLPDLLWKLSTPYFCVVPQGTPIVANGLLFPPPSAGPYVLTAHETGGITILEPNPNYRGAEPQRFDRVVYDEGLRATDALSSLSAGHLDHISYDRPLPQGAPSGVTYERRPLMQVHYLAFNTRSAALSDAAQRRAVSGLLDLAPLAESMEESPRPSFCQPHFAPLRRQPSRP